MRWRNAQTGEVETHDIRHVFVMTGATPNTQWLDGCVALDDKGFIKTGPDLSPEDLARRDWPLARAAAPARDQPAGRLRGRRRARRQLKRVASAVGEGSIAVSFVRVLDPAL